MLPRKLVETAFQRLLLVLAPIIAIPALLLLIAPDKLPEYRSVSTVWVADRLAPDPLAPTRASPWVTHSQTQAAVVADLLRTQTFQEGVATEAGLIGEGSPEFERRLAAARVWAAVSVNAIGANLIEVSAREGSPQIAQGMVSATVRGYLERAAEEMQKQTQLATDYYNQQLVLAQETLQRRLADVQKYVLEHPGASDPRNGDIQYRSLVARYETQDRGVEDLRDALQRVQLNQASSGTGQEARVSVQDEANLPDSPVPLTLRERLTYPLAGLLFGLGIATAYLFMTFRTDHTIRSVEDIETIDVRLLGYVPKLATQPRGRLRRLLRPVAFLRRKEPNYARRLAASTFGPPPPTGERR